MGSFVNRPDFAVTARAIDVSVSDATLNAECIYIGTAGDVNVVLQDDTTAVLFKNVPAGTTLPFVLSEVKNASTTATDIVALK